MSKYLTAYGSFGVLWFSVTVQILYSELQIEMPLEKDFSNAEKLASYMLSIGLGTACPNMVWHFGRLAFGSSEIVSIEAFSSFTCLLSPSQTSIGWTSLLANQADTNDTMVRYQPLALLAVWAGAKSC